MNIYIQDFAPHRDKIFIADLERGMAKTAGGIIMSDDNMTNRGIRARWARVILTGEDITSVKPGDWVLIEHGRWSYGIDLIDRNTDEKITIWHAEEKAMMMACDEDPRPEGYQF